MTHKPWACSRCGKRSTQRHGTKAHIDAYHHGDGEPLHKPRTRRDDDEDSFADRAIAAEQDKAAVIHNPDQDWLLPQ